MAIIDHEGSKIYETFHGSILISNVDKNLEPSNQTHNGISG